MPKDDEEILKKVPHTKAKSRIDWSTIKVRIVSADRDHPNGLNPHTGLSAKERERALVSICGRIWARHIKDKMLKEKANI